ncbi:MAG: ABC transporter ATP-binding protein [Peptococcaceae bacterium]|nr:ABC transporter ATP-binding protein [Peptococcaceae bacterium]
MIEVSNLTFTYPGSGKPAVKDIGFSAEAGSIFGFLGPSGAGKSTAQKIMTGLLKGYLGKVRVLGRDLKSWGRDYYERIGVSFELPVHYKKLSALENLEFFRSLYSVETENPKKLLEMVGLLEDAGTKAARLSKGMQMRLNFARALVNKPDLLFLDEPTSGMDPVNARKIKDIILRKKQAGCTVFLTTHNMSVAGELCDRVAFIVDGEITLIDSPRNLKIRWGERRVRVEYRSGDGVARREFPLDGLGDNREFMDLLRGGQIETIHTKEATMEDIFIKVTGRSLT